MKRYLKLVDFELGRFLKLYLVLMGITILSQIAGVIIASNSYLSNVEEQIYEYNMSIQAFITEFGTMSFYNVSQTIFFIGPISLCVVSLLIYVFFIWYRDWFGKNTFIYRLLMLPTARLNVFLAKATAIFLMVLGLIALQIVLLPIERLIFEWMVPIDFRTDLTLIEMMRTFDTMGILFPGSFTDFAIHYGIGFMTVIVAFTIIMFERCFRAKGIIVGLLYGIATVFVFISPLLIDAFLLPNYFYPIEFLILFGITGIIVISCSLWVSHYLLTKKIRV